MRLHNGCATTTTSCHMEVNGEMAHSKAYMDLMNSKRWKQVRALKLQQVGGYCELCTAQGWHDLQAVAVDVHHKIPIESATSMEEMKRLAYNPANLMSLCDECHHKIHEEMRSFDPANVKTRAEARQARWADNIVNRFLLSAHRESEYTEYEEIKEEL